MMLRRNSPYGNDSSDADSIKSNGYSTMDESSQASNLSRPSAKSIYLQRKEYAVSLNKTMDKFQHRVEHLLTCDLDGKELRSVADCVERLNLLEGIGRVWGQSMVLEVRGPKLLLTDIETKAELESVALSEIVELKAVLDSGVFDSLLTVSVQARKKHNTTVFMFLCEDVRADYVQKNLLQALSRRKDDSNMSNGGNQGMKSRNTKPPPKEKKPEMPQWAAPDYDEDDSGSELSGDDGPSLPREALSSPRPYTELERNVDILNHVVDDIEIFVGQVSAIVAKNAKKKKKKKGKALNGMPTIPEFAACLQKFKYGFNILGLLNGKINNPGAPEFIHSLFTALALVVSHCPDGLPPTIVAPLLTPHSIRLMSEEASVIEDQLWQSLGDAWNIPSTQWPEDDDDIPTYHPEFFDGWQPPEVSATPEPRWENPQPASNKKLRSPRSPKKTRSGEPKQRMRVKYDFLSRNERELSVRKGDVVELLDKSKQWWKVRDSRGEEGYVPNNVLEAQDEQPVQQTAGPPMLTKRSKPAEVKAWLEYKGFSKITVRCLGGLSGSMLLGMTREELKMVCTEEGGRVFFQLQAVKSHLAAAS